MMRKEVVYICILIFLDCPALQNASVVTVDFFTCISYSVASDMN